MPNKSTFPAFSSLPVDIRKDIWVEAVKTSISYPSMYFFNINRDIDVNVQKILDRNLQEIGDRWLGNPSRGDMETLVQLIQEVSTAKHEFYTSVIGLAPTVERTGLAQYSAFHQLGQILATSKEARECSRKAFEGIRRTTSSLVLGDDYGDKGHAVVDPSRDIVCFTGPENTTTSHVPFFTERTLDNLALLSTYGQGMELIKPENHERALKHRSQFSVSPKDDYSYHVSLVDAYPYLKAVERVAFNYREPVDSTPPSGQKATYSERIGLSELWPGNLPGLKEVYFIDESISLKPGIQRPPSSTPAFEGFGATFYEVTKSDTEVWDIKITSGYPPAAVFRDAEYLHSQYCGTLGFHSHNAPAVKVLACVPHDGSIGERKHKA